MAIKYIWYLLLRINTILTDEIYQNLCILLTLATYMHVRLTY